MSFPPGTEMFQFPGFAPAAYGFGGRYPSRGGLPHSEIPGSRPARGSPGLFAACHVLRRLSTPRHPPDALLSLAPPRRQHHRDGASHTHAGRRTAAPKGGGRRPPVSPASPDRGPGRPASTTPPHDGKRTEGAADAAPNGTAPPEGRGARTCRPPATPLGVVPSLRDGGPGPTRTADLTLIRRAL